MRLIDCGIGILWHTGVRTICLCGRHLRDYINCYIVKRDWTVRVCEVCEWCDRLGFVYTLENKSGREADG